MASASRSVCRSLLQISRVNPAKRKCLAQCQRQFSITALRRDSKPQPTIPEPTYFKNIDETLTELRPRAEKASRSVSEEDREAFRVIYDPQPEEYLSPEQPLTLADLTLEERSDYDALPATERDDYLPRLNHYKAVSERTSFEMDEEVQDKVESRVNRLFPMDVGVPKAISPRTGAGYWAEDEVDEFGQMPDDDDDWDPSMMTTVAENELQLHREIRQYTRVAAWEMPLLGKLADKPFTAPTTSTPLRFRYTTYMGETHPAARKVVLEFTSRDLAASLGLPDAQRLKLTKLLGPRYNPTTDIARLSAEKFPHAAQNKRYLGDLLGSLLKEARSKGDMFEDVPLDTRHVRPTKKVPFPEAWLMTGARVAELAEERRPKDLPLRNERDEGSQGRVAEYMAKMPLGRRELPSAAAAEQERVPEMETVRVR